MADDVGRYRDKRDFGRTPEPEPGAPLERGDTPVFVVHQHEARSLHWDLRLEMEGVLRSWAVPKGFSYDPSVKHLAVRTEDHPIEYEDFHGWIPPGEYGAGRMTIWDRGTYTVVHAPDGPTAVADGEVKVVLRGRRLRGEWHLVKTKQGPNTWLLFKSKDRFAGPERDSALGLDLEAAREGEMPARLKPMESEGVRPVFDDPEWLFEPELDGERLLAEKRGGTVRLRGKRRVPDAVAAALERLRAETALIDGVLVPLEAGAGASHVYYAFDVLFWEEFDLRPLRLLDRKRALRAVLPEDPEPLLYLDHVLGHGEALADAAVREGVGALVARRADAPYRSGPSPDRVRVPLAEAADAEDLGDAARARPARRTRVRLTNLEKIFWPAEGYTKGDLIGYYETVADVLLPHLLERPVHLERFPDGIEGKRFYQRHPPEDGTPEWIETEVMESSEGIDKRHVICTGRDTLTWMINTGSIDLHPWMSRRGSDASPDWSVIDLDAKQATWPDVVAVARRAGEVLRAIGLRGVLKTSGKSGLHVFVPLAPGYSYDQSRMFCEGVARVVARELPEIATVERIPSNRGARVYVDFGQNGRAQTVVAPYVVRPVPGATVSAPLEWSELTGALRREEFTLRTMPARIEERGDLFRGALDDPQDLMPAIEKLAEYVKAG